jgi:glycosyltransferase involved in cell wall biosynthesis
MHTPVKVSVVLITYNQKKYVREALESILMQHTSFPIEVLVSDDASTDGTAQILRDMKKKYEGRFSLFVRRHNSGATRNAYAMLKRCNGDYIASLEGDDRWTDRNFLERAVKFLEDNNGFIGVQDKCRVIDTNSNPIIDQKMFKGKDFWKYDGQEYTVNEFCKWKMPGHISGLVYRNIYRDTPGDYSVIAKMHPMVGDRTIIMELVVRGPIYCTNHVSMDYRLNLIQGGVNWMADQHSKNNRFQEYTHICRIAGYMKSHFNHKISFASLKRSKIAAAAIVYMNDRASENFKALKKIIIYENHPVRDALIALFAVCQKKIWIIMGRPEHRVWI